MNLNVVEPHPKRRGTIAAKTLRRLPCAPCITEHSVLVQGTCTFTWLMLMLLLLLLLQLLTRDTAKLELWNLAASRKPSGGDKSSASAFFHAASATDQGAPLNKLHVCCQRNYKLGLQWHQTARDSPSAFGSATINHQHDPARPLDSTSSSPTQRRIYTQQLLYSRILIINYRPSFVHPPPPHRQERGEPWRGASPSARPFATLSNTGPTLFPDA